ncbi:hypothetical protein GOBAR_AA00482 [Gossypium barbadense]|uniref:DUF4283 domain-containing protein n=1 Tax=Gossypium barbadense TaxID=3634 RepID=A0A2P5YX14_GOSBA|nr:hypothetical protein GOBAR_AA00482 [Gossypium barbadense]
MSETLPTVDFEVDANNSSSTSGIRRATKKVRTKPEIQLEILKASYKSTFLGVLSEKNNGGFLEEEFTLLDGDAVTEVIEGVPLITLSKRVQEFFQQRMTNTVIVKLLGGSISRRVVDNFWQIPNCSPMVTGVFNKSEWLLLNGQTIGLVVKLDVHTDCACRGRFARLAICVDLKKPLVSKTAPLVKESGCARLVMEKLCLENNVEDKPYGSWMVMERRRGRSQASGEGRNDDFGGIAKRSHFTALEGWGYGVKVSRKNDVIETKGKQAKLRAKGKKMVMGSRPKSTLKVLKPNNGNFNIGRGAFDDGSRLAQVGAIDRGKAIVMEKVEISANLNKEKHAAVRILEKEKMRVNTDKENGIFMFGKMSSPIAQHCVLTLLTINSEGNHPMRLSGSRNSDQLISN